MREYKKRERRQVSFNTEDAVELELLKLADREDINFSGLVKNVWFGIKTCFLASKFYFSMKLVILMFTTLIPLVNLWLWKEGDALCRLFVE